MSAADAPERPSPPRRSLRARGAAFVRLALYLSVVGIGLTGWGVHVAKADAEKAALALGKKLLPLVELETERSALRVNGQALNVSSAIVDGTPKSVLERAGEGCDKGSFAAPLDVFRRATDDEGVVFCFVRPPGRGLSRALADFRATRDLGVFGALRYTFAKKTEDGRVRVLATWTEGSFRLDETLPNGDAAGSDPIAAPRPPRATRLLSATLGEGARGDNAPYGMYAFASADGPAEVMRFYDESLARGGWVRFAPPSEVTASGVKVTGAPEEGRIYEKDGVELVVSAARRAGDTRTHVSVGELGLRQR